MIEELTKTVRVIRDLKRAIRVLELVRDSAQQAINETPSYYLKYGGWVETNPATARRLACIDACNRSIRALAARIDELAIGD